ncbi:MAG: hypothetical protein PF694_00900 [Bacteroidetes bacterium]|jgi:hypothetical protein|nr:hypothetical protein [Bacteroidota bacterium]
MITKQQARKVLLIGYLMAIAGLLLGLTTDIYSEPLSSSLYLAYVFWSVYHGMGLIGRAFDDFFSSMFVFEQNFFQLIWAYLVKKMFLLIIKLVLAMIIGVCGGAIYRQVVLSRIAY